MRNLFDFIWKNQFTFLFLVLEVIGFYLLGTNNSHQQTKLHGVSTAISGAIYNVQYGYTQYLGLRDENEKLRQENALLEQLNLNEKQPELTEKLGFECIPSVAINSSYNREKNFIIINSGSVDGVLRESGVIGPSGVVGIVHSVSKNYASVLPLLHSDSKISGRLKGTQYFGQCRWQGLDDRFITLENIPNHVTFKQGDTIITRGSRGVFPPGLDIGFVESTVRDESSGFQELKVRLATDFRKLNSVYIIVNEHKTELDSLFTETEEWID